MSESLHVRASLVATNEMSPAIRKVIADIERLKAVAKNLSASFNNVGRAGIASMSGFDRTIKAVTAQMHGLSNVSRSSARTYATDWDRATAKRLSDSRRMYAELSRMESRYQTQMERRITAEHRASGGSRGAGRLPAPRIRSLAIGGAIAGASIGSAIRKRIETEAAEVRAQMFGDLSKMDVESLRKGFADKAGIKFGVGTSKVIDVAVEGLKAGIAKEVAGEFADLALKAQAGLDVDTAGVGKLLGRLATQMPWSKDRFSKILNAVAVSNNSTAADGNEIIEAMRRSLSALATTKMTPEQLAAIDSTGISLGVQPFKMGTFVSFLTSQVAGADSAHGQQANDLSSAANALGFGGRRAMAKAMRDRPMEAIQQILDNLAKMPEALRTKVAKQIGGREWMDELLTLVLGRDKLKDVLRDIEGKPGFLDKTALQKIRSMQGRWASIVAAFGLIWERVGAGFEKWFDQISDGIIGLADSFNFDTIKAHVDALVDGMRDGFGLKDWGEAITSLADNFGAGTIAKWRDFGKGFAEGIREFASGLKVAFSALGFLAGKNPADAKEMGNLVAKLTGLSVALAVIAPGLSVLAALCLGLTGLGTALAFIGGIPAAVALLSLFAARNQDVGLADDKIRKKGESYSDWQERIAKRKSLRNYRPSGDPMFQPTSYTGSTDFSGRRRSTGQDLADSLRQFTGKVERAAFINGSNGVTKTFYTGGSGGGMTIAGGGGGAGSFIRGVPGLLTNKPGASLPGSILGSSGIIRRDNVPSFYGSAGKPSIVNPQNIPSFYGGSGSAGDNVGAGLSGNAFLQARRSRFAEELKSDPSLRLHLAAIQATEGISQGGTIESLMNRADMQGRTLRQMLGFSADGVRSVDRRGKYNSFYGPIRRGEIYGAIQRLKRNPAEFAKYDAYTNRALAGSHVIGGHTDQGLPTDPNGSARTGIPGLRLRGKNGKLDGNEFTDWVGPGSAYGRGRAGAINYRKMIEQGIAGSGSVTSSVPTPAETIQNVPTPSSIRGDASLGLQRGGGPVTINVNGNSHDPEALATLVQRRVDESMNWRTHDTSSEYT